MGTTCMTWLGKEGVTHFLVPSQRQFLTPSDGSQGCRARRLPRNKIIDSHRGLPQDVGVS